MPKLLWAVPCCRIITDQATNMVSYIDALDGAVLSGFPTKAPGTFIGTIWQRGSESKIEMRVRTYAPDGSHLMDAIAEPLVFEANHKRGRINVGIIGFDLESPGRYGFGIEIKQLGKWVEVTRIPFEVDQASDTRDPKK